MPELVLPHLPEHNSTQALLPGPRHLTGNRGWTIEAIPVRGDVSVRTAHLVNDLCVGFDLRATLMFTAAIRHLRKACRYHYFFK